MKFGCRETGDHEKEDLGMAILINEEKKLFTLNTKNTTYQMKVIDYGYLAHLYYGKKMDGDMSYVITHYDRGFSGNPYEAQEHREFSLDNIPLEYSCYGNGDFRTPAFNIKDIEGIHGCDLRYVSYEVMDSKYSLKGLPAAYTNDGEKGETLKIVLQDPQVGVEVDLLYGIIEDKDLITRSAIIRNISDADIFVAKASSVSLDFVTGDYDLIHFHGRHAMERMYEREAINHGVKKIGSTRGTSSHQHSPFVVIAGKDANEDAGDCYGISLLYSGSFNCEVEKDQTDQVRLNMGVQDEMFEYVLYPESEFVAPEVVMVYSPDGFADMSHKMHDVVRYNICRGEYKTKRRPILINSWEAVYFDFNGDDIVNIAKQASELGVEMLVLDDGWFGARNNDRAGLGDWFVNPAKFTGGLDELIGNVNALGMDFGLWVEPEMVNPDSDLYRAHPDWTYHFPHRHADELRHQLVLNMTRSDVQAYILDCMDRLLTDHNIRYIKWDMNRPFSQVGAENLADPKMYSYLHTMAVYRIVDELKRRHPAVQFESCASGGGRCDLGAISHFDQVWTSDNTDGIDRMTIQIGYSMLHPIKTMRAWVTDIAGINKPCSLDFRFHIAMQGALGLGGNLEKYSPEELEICRRNVALYK